MPDARRPTPEVMATLYLALLLVAAALVSASDLDASFCADCKWKQSDFTCGFRVKFLVDHYKVKEEEVRQDARGDSFGMRPCITARRLTSACTCDRLCASLSRPSNLF